MMAGRAELAGLIGRHAGRDGVHATAIGGLTLSRLSAPTAPDGVLYQPSFCVIAQGRKRVILGEEAYLYDPAHFLLASVDLPVVCDILEATPEVPFLGLRLDLDLACVGEMLTAAAPADAPTARGLDVSPLDPTLLDAVARLVALLDAPRDVPVVAPLILREIAYRLLTGPQGGRLRQMATEGGRTRRVARAIDRLRADFARPLRVDDLAREAHMSASTFHEHFKAVTAMSPLQYQKRLRLQEARRLMLAESLDAASAAYRVGYESASQFSREYRRAFGDPPRRDLARLRATSA